LWERGTTRGERRTQVVSTVRAALDTAEASADAGAVRGFATACMKPRQALIDTAETRWDLSLQSPAAVKLRCPNVTDLLEPRQGVTPGGCLSIFLLSEEEVNRLGLEDALVHKAIKSREITMWAFNWQRRFLLYPYVITQQNGQPAFEGRFERISDALDFEVILDDQEREIRRGRGPNAATLLGILEHRVGLGIVSFPQAAKYLVSHYEMLEGRQFKKRNIREFGRRWYEYLWPRDPALMLGKRRIVSPSLVRSGQVRFALDSAGYLSDHACVYLLPSRSTAGAMQEFRRDLSRVLRREATDLDALQYCLAFLNSPYAEERLVTGRRPTPKGYYQISEAYLREIPIALPRHKKEAELILTKAQHLVKGTGPAGRTSEDDLFRAVTRLLAGASEAEGK
jgi:hypothetical protein